MFCDRRPKIEQYETIEEWEDAIVEYTRTCNRSLHHSIDKSEKEKNSNSKELEKVLKYNYG